MTRAEFLAEALSFPLGSVVFVSGKDIASVTALLEEAKADIEASTAKPVLVFNSRDTVPFPQRYFASQDATDVMTPISDEAMRLREFDALIAENSYVVLMANEFDRDDPDQNRRKRSITIDVLLDLFRANQVKDIPFGFHRYYGTREVYPYATKIYYVDTDTDEVTFVKDQNPHRP